MVIFHSYVSLPEGKNSDHHIENHPSISILRRTSPVSAPHGGMAGTSDISWSEVCPKNDGTLVWKMFLFFFSDVISKLT